MFRDRKWLFHGRPRIG